MLEGLRPGTAYTVKVRQFDGGGWSGTLSANYTTPSFQSDPQVQTSWNADGSLTVNWGTRGQYDELHLWDRPYFATDRQTRGGISYTATGATVSGLLPGQRYYLRAEIGLRNHYGDWMQTA